MNEIRRVSLKEIKENLGDLPRTVLCSPRYEYWALFDGEKMVSCAGVYNSRFHSIYTPAELRNKGYATQLVSDILEIYPTLDALCTQDSIGIFLRLGYSVIGIYNRVNKKGEKYTLWKVKR